MNLYLHVFVGMLGAWCWVYMDPGIAIFMAKL